MQKKRTIQRNSSCSQNGIIYWEKASPIYKDLSELFKAEKTW